MRRRAPLVRASSLFLSASRPTIPSQNRTPWEGKHCRGGKPFPRWDRSGTAQASLGQVEETVGGLACPPPIMGRGQDGTTSAEESGDDRVETVHAQQITADGRVKIGRATCRER